MNFLMSNKNFPQQLQASHNNSSSDVQFERETGSNISKSEQQPLTCWQRLTSDKVKCSLIIAIFFICVLVGSNIYFAIEAFKPHPASTMHMEKVQFSPNCTGVKAVFETPDGKPEEGITFKPQCALPASVQGTNAAADDRVQVAGYQRRTSWKKILDSFGKYIWRQVIEWVYTGGDDDSQQSTNGGVKSFGIAILLLYLMALFNARDIH